MHFEMVPKKPLKLLMAILTQLINVTKTTIKLPFHLLISGRTDDLAQFLKPINGNHSRWVLCYRASTHGWRISTFHTKCDGKRDTVSIIKVGQYVFGGYTDISWGKSIIPRHLSWRRGNRRILRDDMVFRGNGDGISRR